MNKPDLSIVVPCYNEADNIPELITRFARVIDDQPIELVIVNNGSNDLSAEILAKYQQQYLFITVVDIKINQGYGYGIMAGLRQAKADCLGWTHADLQTDPSDVIKAFHLLQEQKETNRCYIKGDRKGRPLFDQIFTMGMSLFETLYLATRLWDINAQPNIFHRSFFDKWKSKAPDDFSLDLFVLYQANLEKLNIIRFEVYFPDRIHGQSSWNTSLLGKWKFIKRTILFSTNLKRGLIK